jgi:nitric oxide dioxygenase
MMDQVVGAQTDTQGRPSFVPYRVLDRTAESSVITSFRMMPVKGGPVPAFKPGQYLTLSPVTDRATCTMLLFLEA